MGSPTRMAATGQGATQAPQPVQDSRSISGLATRPGTGRKRMASTGQQSRQAWQTTPAAARQDWPTQAATAHGAAARSNTGAGQTSAQVPQNVHSPRVKSTSGRPLSPPSRIPSGQARMQASHRVHSSPNWSSRAQGGRIGW